MNDARERLTALRDAGVLNALDVHLALSLGRMSGETSTDALLAVALASHGVRHGQVCVRLLRADDRPIGEPVRGSDPGLRAIEWPEPTAWVDQLRRSPLVGPDHAGRPLVLTAGGDLYLARYRAYERELLGALCDRIAAPRRAVDKDGLRASLDRLFGQRQPAEPVDWQRVAALTAALRSLVIITGGPGTGKTTTVVRLLAVLQELQLARGDAPLRVLLLAPTGKAAARLAESIHERRDELDVSDTVRSSLDGTVSTIHRALGIRPGSRDGRYDSTRPLPADVVVIDESSMVDLSLMTRVVTAVPPHARLVLLGDRDQLASVEAGAILGDLCNGGRALPPWSAAAREDLIEIGGVPSDLLDPSPTDIDVPVEAGIRDSIVELKHSHRFASGGQIATLAAAVRDGDSKRAGTILAAAADAPTARSAEGHGRATTSGAIVSGTSTKSESGPPLELVFHELGRREDPARLARSHLADALQRFRSTSFDDPVGALRALGSFRVLCAHRGGPLGSEAFNRALQAGFMQDRSLRGDGGADLDGYWFPWRPVMITMNDYQLGLYNGDVGVALPTPDDPSVSAAASGSRGQRLRVHFPGPPDPDGSGPVVRSFHPARVPLHETVYAMTVHKSQGSEFDEVLLVLPSHASPILTRELIYTGITRARRRLVIAATRSVFLAGLEARIRRASGLREALFKDIATRYPAPRGLDAALPTSPSRRIQRRLF